MELENQVVSLELAKRLKELGVKQDSICQLVRFSDRPDGTEHYVLDMLCRMGQNGNETYSAFTVAELGEMLPSIISRYEFKSKKTPTKNWFCYYEKEELKGNFNQSLYIQFANTEADARAKLLIYLLENNLIKE